MEIRNPEHFTLIEPVRALLQALYSEYETVLIRKEFNKGFTGQVLMVQGWRRGTADLPTVAKFAPASLIEDEEKAYQTYVHRQLPKVPDLQHEDVYEDGWGALRYGLIGDGQFEVNSLHEWMETRPIDEIEFVLDRLFDIFEPWWQNKSKLSATQLRGHYDYVLPANLIIRFGSPPDGVNVLEVTANEPRKCQVGDWVVLKRPRIQKVNIERNTMLVALMGRHDSAPLMHRVDVENVQFPDVYEVGNTVRQLTGQVIATRADVLQKFSQDCGVAGGLTAETIQLIGKSYPNPLSAFDKILSTFRDVHVSYVHGDLNLNNALVDTKTKEVSIIDFGATSKNHVLHDFLRLETEIIMKFLGETPLDALAELYRRLHLSVNYPQITGNADLGKPFQMIKKVREMVGRYLFRKEDWAEYYDGLVVYLLGALRFKNVSKEARLRAFYVAAFACDMVQSPPTFEVYADEFGLDMAEQARLRAELLVEKKAAERRPNIVIHGDGNIVGNNNQSNITKRWVT